MAKRREKGKPGARRKLDNRARRKRLIDTLLRTGQRTKAVRAAGITFQCLEDSIERDDELRAAVEEVEKRAIAAARDCVNGSVATDPLMALRLLERKLPDEYGRRQQQQTHIQTNVHVIAGDPIFMSPERRRAILVSLMGQSAAELDATAENGLAGTAADSIIDGTAVGTDAGNTSKVLPPSSVAKANGHAGNGKH